MVNKNPDILQSSENQSAEIANRFYDMAEEGQGAKDPKMREMFSGVGRETAQGNFDKGQRILEVDAKWDDNLRSAASEINQLDREKRGAEPISFEEAKKVMVGYARGFEEDKDFKNAAAIDSIVGGTSRPGIEGIDEVLQYIEGILKSQVDRMSGPKTEGIAGQEVQKLDTLKALRERRAVRDALFLEKQKRVEKMQESRRVTEEVVKGRGETAKKLENMFGRAGMPDDMPSREQFLERVGRMSSEELHFLDSALGKLMSEFGRSQQNPDLLAARLQEMGSQSYRKEDVVRRQKYEDKRRIDEIHRELGLEGSSKQQSTEPKGRTEGPSRREVVAESRPLTREMPGQERKSENLVYEKITYENFDKYRKQGKEVMLNEKTWQIDSVDSDGNVFLRRDITIAEALKLAEKGRRGEEHDVNSEATKVRGGSVTQGDLFRGQWIVEKPSRSPQNLERQKEVNEVKALQAKLVLGEFAENKSGEYDLLEYVFDREAARLEKEQDDYKRSAEKR